MKTTLLCLITAAALSMTASCAANAAEAVKKAQDKSAPAPKDKAVKAEKKEPAKEPLMSDDKRAEWIEQTLEYGIQEDRARAMGMILKIKDAGLQGRLAAKVIGLMKDEEDPELLIKAFTVLGEMKESSALPLLTEKIDHQSEDVRTAAVYAIKKMNAVSTKDRLAEKLKAQDAGINSNFTTALIQTLGDFKAADMVPFARQTLESPKTHKAVKEEMVMFLGKVPSAESKDVLLKIFKDEGEDETLRSYAVNSLSKLGMKEVSADIKQVITIIDSYDTKKRKKYYTLYLYSIAALARLGDQEAVPKLINALRSNSAQVRLKAISLIKEFKDKRTIDILKYKMKNDPNPRVQKAAKKALTAMGIEIEKDPEPKKDLKKESKKDIDIKKETKK
jgi:HEAT repeat protein